MSTCHVAVEASGEASRCPIVVVWLLSLAARSWPFGENASSWMASATPGSGASPNNDRSSSGPPSMFQTWTTPPWPPTASVVPSGDHASAVIGSPEGLIVKYARRPSVAVENTPTVEGAIGTANRVPSGDSASAGSGGETRSQQGRLPASRALRPKPRLPVRSHASTTPPSAEVYSVEPSGTRLCVLHMPGRTR